MYLQTNLSSNKKYAAFYMYVISLFKKKINKFQNEEYFSNCKKKYYREVGFVNIYENIKNLSHYKTLEQKDIASKNYYTIAYFDNNRLVRLDEIINEKPVSKTFLIYKNRILDKVYKFELIKIYRNQKFELMSIWSYNYVQDKLNKIVWKNYADYKKAHHNTDYLIEYLVWDEKGVESIYKTFIRNELIMNVTVYKKILHKKRGLTEKEITSLNNKNT